MFIPQVSPRSVPINRAASPAPAVRKPDDGRVHDAAIDADFEPGEEFDLYGRRWSVVDIPRRRALSGARATPCSLPVHEQSPLLDSPGR